MSDFIRDIVGAPAVIAGNSIGAVTVLSAAFLDPSLVRGMVLLNAAGRFDEPETAAAATEAPAPSGVAAAFSELFRRVVSAAIFYSTKYRIGSILKTVYVDHSKVDEALVQSIYAPACDPNALEAFYKISGSGGRSKQSLNVLLKAGLSAPGGPLPLLLLWGLEGAAAHTLCCSRLARVASQRRVDARMRADPWMKPDKAQRIVDLYPGAKLVKIAAGSHCPHDDAPAEVNSALLEWMAALPAAAVLSSLLAVILCSAVHACSCTSALPAWTFIASTTATTAPASPAFTRSAAA